ncbi:hypothetical protein KR018_003904, partial [Drosophila ironensis]
NFEPIVTIVLCINLDTGSTIVKFQDSVTFKMTNAVCESYNESWVVIHQCRLKAVSRSKILFNFNGTIHHPASQITNHIRMLKRESGYKPWLINVKIDCCRFMFKPYNSYGIFFFNIWRRFTNINHTCPYVGTVLLKDMYLTTEAMRLPFPTGEYMLAIDWIFHRKLQFATNISFEFVEDLLK